MHRKIYCYQYNIAKNSVLYQEFTLQPKDDKDYPYYVLLNKYDNHEPIYVRKEDVDNEIVQSLASEKIIYIYTFKNDVNHALELFNKTFKECIEEEQAKLKQVKKAFNSLVDKQKEIKAKYPTGKRE